VHIESKGDPPVAKEVMMLSTGDYFGEQALAESTKRSTSVKAVGRVLCEELSKGAFEEILGLVSL
jgi:CRP-like cAMP-binding protein